MSYGLFRLSSNARIKPAGENLYQAIHEILAK